MRGFDFLGYHFGSEGLTIAEKTLNNFVERANRLYEQGPGEPSGSTRLGEYAKRWVRWAGAGLGNAVPCDFKWCRVMCSRGSTPVAGGYNTVTGKE